MTIDVDAVYEDGVLKPERPLALKDKSKVHVTIEAKAEELPDPDDPTGWKARRAARPARQEPRPRQSSLRGIRGPPAL